MIEPVFANSHLGGEGRRLARALETGAAGGFPCDDVALAVGEGDDRVVKAGLDVSLAYGYVLANPPSPPASGALLGHYLLTFFLPATCMRRGPLRPRALVLVR